MLRALIVFHLHPNAAFCTPCPRQQGGPFSSCEERGKVGCAMLRPPLRCYKSRFSCWVNAGALRKLHFVHCTQCTLDKILARKEHHTSMPSWAQAFHLTRIHFSLLEALAFCDQGSARREIIMGIFGASLPASMERGCPRNLLSVIGQDML